MMNIDVLFQSADLTGNDTLRDIATSHANTTLKNHIRSDGILCHLSLYSYLILAIGQDPHGMLLNITQPPVVSSKNGRHKAILTPVHGHVAKHGVYMASQRVRICLQ